LIIDQEEYDELQSIIERKAEQESIEYPILVNSLLKYIIDKKEKDRETSIMDLILEYSMRNSMDIELIGDAISTDEYFKGIIEKDLEIHNYSSTKRVNDDW